MVVLCLLKNGGIDLEKIIERQKLRVVVSGLRKWKMLDNYEAKRRELELLFSLEDRMEDIQKIMLMEKLMDDYWLTEHDGDIPNNQ